jgi:hypothetical protein
VKQIAYGNNLLRLKIVNQRYKPLQVFFKNSLWNGNACFAEVTGFSKMKVGYNERFFGFPKRTALGGKPKSLIPDFMWKRWLHASVQRYCRSGVCRALQ